MKKFVPTPQKEKKLLFQICLVCSAFFIMIVANSIFAAYIVNRNMMTYGDEVVGSAVEALDAYIYEAKITLDDIGLSVEKLWNETRNHDDILNELTAWTEWIRDKNPRFESLKSVYGVIDYKFIDGSGWIPNSSFIPETRPWYSGALEKYGGVAYSDPYIDAQTKNYVFTVSKLVFDENSQPFGVIAVDMFISGISGYSDDLEIMDKGYGVLMDKSMNIFKHYEESFIGLNISDNELGAGYMEMASVLEEERKVSAFKFNDYNNVRSVAFFRELFNGWYVGVISPSNAYYSTLIYTIAALTVTGFALMATVCAGLIFIRKD